MESEFTEIALKMIVILGGAKLLAVLLERVGQEAVLGELLLGIVLGPSVLRLLDPKGDPVLAFLAELGIVVLVFYIGLVAELDLFIRAWRPSLRVALVGMAIFLGAGTLVGLGAGLSLLGALFLGAALMATSMGKAGRLLVATQRMLLPAGMTVLGAALLDDLIALWLLAGLQAWAGPRPFRWELFVLEGLGSLLFLVGGLWLGVRLAPRLFRLLESLETRGMIIVAALVFCLGLAVAAKGLGLALIVGAFAAGLMLEYVHHERQITRQVETLVDLFVPFYFVKAGALLDLALLTEWKVLVSVLGLTAFAIAGKLLSGLGAERGQRWLVGVGMIPRGEVGLIFATAGLELGLLSKELYAALLAMILLTTFITPLLLRFSLRRAPL
ncbi:Na(+)/H(+)-K(+) antiporter GerN [bacterium HR07]|uniref:Na+/H+-exchanging protein n=2 Tax=Candidatus Bipolaricaulota TaxID=67810 RepID=H5SPU6_9BACT|nr:Na+/H+-exchanging protein [uncultured Acetothermia bacterium]BAL58182.1 Na+/H+-exchanging protein [uncultured Acetothermia bacterium]BAL59906.1 Na+/H+-exchanging protein [Candidatus Acetothermum autotrophicum]GBC75844.1 Na(+)/H(+)-K(+) antiporter GerN [bacterium HR07]